MSNMMSKNVMGNFPKSVSQYISSQKFKWNVAELTQDHRSGRDRLNHFFDYLKKEKSTYLVSRLSFAKIKNLYEVNPNGFYLAMMGSVYQGFRVTSNATDILSNGLQLHGVNRTALLGFIEEEKGHDKFMESTLDNLSELCGVSWRDRSKFNYDSLSNLLGLFRWSSQNFLLSFCSLIYEFESAPALENDPFWSWINQDKKLRNIFSGVLRHKRVNSIGRHDLIHLDIIEKHMEFETADYIFAARLQEAAVLMKLQNNLDVFDH